MNGAVLLGISLLAGVLGASGSDAIESPVQNPVRVAVVPSNQGYEKYSCQCLDGREATEEYWAMRVSEACVDELRLLGFGARMFHIPGEGLHCQDELEAMLSQALVFEPDILEESVRLAQRLFQSVMPLIRPHFGAAYKRIGVTA